MIKLPPEIQLKYEANVIQYKYQIEDLKQKSITAKKILLSTQFNPYPNEGNLDDKIDFVLQFLDFILDLVLFPDEQVLTKLRDLKFAKHSLKWFTKLEDILFEIDRINKIEGIFFLPNSNLFAILTHLQIKFLISMIEDFGLFTDYNNADTNLIFKYFAERFRRREYNEKKKQSPKMDWFEKCMNRQFDYLEKATEGDKVIAKQLMLQPMKGNTSFYYGMLNMFYSEGISKNKVYLEFYALLKLIIKNKELLSLEEFESRNRNKDYQYNYSAYQISRVKKILQKK